MLWTTQGPEQCGVAYLSTEVEVAEEDGGLGAGDNEDDEDQEEESKHVVHLVGPAPHTPFTHCNKSYTASSTTQYCLSIHLKHTIN